MTHRTPSAFELAVGAMLVAASVAASGPRSGIDRPPLIDRSPMARADEPDAASAFALAKRHSRTPGHDAPAAYRAALEHLDRMPRYSTVFHARLPAAAPAKLAGLAGFMSLRALGTWSSLGPGNIGGRTRTLVIDPVEPQIMYAGGVSGGIWKTTDGGLSWTPLADRVGNIAVNSLVMHPVDRTTLFAGTGEGYFREEVRGTWLPLRGGGVFVTNDSGSSWRQLSSTIGVDFQWVNDLAMSPHDPDRLYAATRTGVLISEDAGETWDHSLEVAVKGGCLDLALRTDLADDWVYASCGTLDQATVYRRKMNRNDGWEPVLSEPGMGRTTLAIAPSSQNVIYALAASNTGGPDGNFVQGLQAVYRSTNAGNPGSWSVRVDNTDASKLNTLILTNPVAAAYLDCGFDESNDWVTMGWYCNTIAVDPVDPDVVWAAGVDLFRSDDGGRSWGVASYWWGREYGPSYVHADQHAVVFHPDYDGITNTTMFAANDGGLFRTDNPNAAIGTDVAALCDPAQSAVQFEDINHNFGITQFYHGLPFPGGDRYIGGTQDNGTLLGDDSFGTDGWLRILGGDGAYSAVDPENTDIIYASSQRFGFNRSDDGGLTFEYADAGINDYGFLFITPVLMDPNESQRLWTGGRRVWRTDDGASLWVPASTNPLGEGQVSAIAIASGNSNAVFIGTTDGSVFRSSSALTADASTVWDRSRPREGYVSSLAFEPGSEQTIYATFADFGGQHVWRSEDGGISWAALDGSGATALPDMPVHAIAIDPDDTDRLYLGTDLGVMTSLDRGRTWTVENTGFAHAVTEWIVIGEDRAGNPWLYAFTHGRGVFKAALRQLPAVRRQPGRRVAQ